MSKNVDITKLIKDVGFPIVVAVGFGYFSFTQYQQFRTDSLLREQRQYEQIQGFQQTMDNFNSTLQNIDGRLENLEKGGM